MSSSTLPAVPWRRLAEDRRGEPSPAVADRVRLPTDKGANPAGKVATVVAGGSVAGTVVAVDGATGAGVVEGAVVVVGAVVAGEATSTVKLKAPSIGWAWPARTDHRPRPCADTTTFRDIGPAFNDSLQRFVTCAPGEFSIFIVISTT